MAKINFDSQALSAALDYAALGWRVFPIERTTNRPLVKNLYENASTDPGTIAEWWETWPEANVALATGWVSDLIVLRISRTQGADSLLGRVTPDGPVVESTAGFDLFMRFPAAWEFESPVNDADLPGLNLQSCYDYVIVPPSFDFDGNEVRWACPLAPLPAAPDWIVDLRGRGLHGSKTLLKSSGLLERRPTVAATAALRSEVHFVLNACNRKILTQLQSSAFRLGTIRAADSNSIEDVEIALNWAAYAKGIDPDQAAEIIDRAGLEHPQPIASGDDPSSQLRVILSESVP